MNVFDIIVMAILAGCVFIGYHRGLIKTVFRLVSFGLSIFLASQLYPYVGGFLRGTALFESLKATIVQSMGLEKVFKEHTAFQQAELINSLPLPEALQDLLLSNNTPDVYEILRVDTIADYIAGFFANIILNIIAMIVVFILVWVLVNALGNILDKIGKLPLLNNLNQAGGMVAGLLMGVAVVWIGFVLMNLLFVNPSHPEIFALLNSSLLARWFYDNNWLLALLTKI